MTAAFRARNFEHAEVAGNGIQLKFFRAIHEWMLQYAVTTMTKKTTKVRELKSMNGGRLLT